MTARQHGSVGVPAHPRITRCGGRLRDHGAMPSSLRLLPAALCAAAVVAVASCDAGTERQPEGQRLANQYGCLACHGDQGQGGTGPSWKGLYGSTVELTDGRTVTVDRDYLVRAVRDPGADVPKGAVITMPANPQVTDQDLQQIVDWIQTLGVAES
jgi:cytochrome c oxidase subunit 2